MNTTPLEQPFSDLPPSKPPLLKPWSRVLLFLITNLVLLIFLGSFVISMAGYSLVEVEEDLAKTELKELYILQIVSLIITLSTVFLFRTYLDRKSVFSLGFAWKKKGQDFAIGFGVGFGVIAIGTLILMVFGQLEFTGWKLHPSLLFSYFLLCILIALNEEILVRGYVLNNLMQGMDKYWALVVSAMVFTFLHALNPNISFLAVFNLMLAGILLGIYYIYEQNLWFPIALHTSWNYSEGAIFGYEVSGIEFQSLLQQNIGEVEWLTGGDFGFEGSLLLSALLIGAIWWVHWRYRRNF